VEERRPIPLRIVGAHLAPDAVWGHLAAAVGLVAADEATQVTIANVEVTDQLAGEAAAFAQGAGVSFAVERDPTTGRRAMRIGPRL
jgi:hypothetical protein